MSESLSDLLSEIYFDPEEGLLSMDKLYKKAKSKNKSITLQYVKDWINKQSSNQIVQAKPKKIVFKTIESKGIKDNFQMDIIPQRN